MSARGFGSVIWAGAVAGAALGFYLVSLKVASERAELEDVETRIALAQRDIRLLQTEIGTRGRLAQLERWNVKFIRLSAPAADQFVEGGFQLATMVTPNKKPAIEAPVVLASATIGQSFAEPKLTGDATQPRAMTSGPRSAGEMMHVAGYRVPEKPASVSVPAKPSLQKPPVAAAGKQPASPAKGATATKSVKSATSDPLAPLPVAKAKAKGSADAATAGGPNPKPALKDSDSD